MSNEEEKSEKELSESKKIEKIEKELPKETKQSSDLSKKIIKIEKSLKEFREESKIKIEKLKNKIAELKRNNLELIGKFKAKSTFTVEYFKKQYSKLAGKFKREDPPRQKRILCYECGDQIGYMRGYVSHSKSGFFIIEDAEFVDYSTSQDPLVLSYIGNACLNQDHVVMWF